jgi:hypothetical protein
MGYLSFEPSGLGEFGCGAGCSCKSCRSAASNLSEAYEKEEAPAPSKPQPPRGSASKIAGPFGEPPLAPRVSLLPGRLRMPAFETLTGYAPGAWRLSPAQLARIRRLAEHIVRTWTTGSPVTGVRLIGFAEPAEAQAAVQRAGAARAALSDAITRLNLSILHSIQFSGEDGGSTPAADGSVRRVEILLWVGLGTPFVPPPPRPSQWSIPQISVTPAVRVPMPAETARKFYRTETPEDQINRILGTLPPAPPPRGSFNQVFWQRVDENLNAAMRRVGVPESLRGLIRRGAHEAITRGANEILGRVLDAASLTGEPREAISATVRAVLEAPVR